MNICMNIFINSRYRKIYKTGEKLFYVIYKKEKVNITELFKKNGEIKKKHNHLIQQKSKKFGGVGNTLVVSSFNVYTWSGWHECPSIFNTAFNRLLSDKKIDLLFTQEDNIKDIDTNESVKAYSKGIEKSNRFTFSSCINTSLQLKSTVPRNAIIIEDTEFGIKIANLHLEGSVVDLELDDSTFQTYLDIKLALLKEVLESSPDIILGDFNSVYCNDQNLLRQMYTGQQTYYNNRYYPVHKKCDKCDEDDGKNKKDERGLVTHIRQGYGLNLIRRCPNSSGKKSLNGGKKIVGSGKVSLNGGKKIVGSGKNSLSNENIITWNNEPFTLLKEKGYIYIEPENIIVQDKINPTNSRGENVIDHFWVKNSIQERFTFSAEIYEGFGDVGYYSLYGGISDHKPIILTIQKKELGNTAEKESDSVEETVEEKEETVEEKAEKEEKVVVKKAGPKTKRKSKRKRSATT